MAIIKDLLFGIPIGILYNLFFDKYITMSYNELAYNERIQKTYTTMFIGSVIGFIIGNTLFYLHKRFKNSIVRMGLNIGSAILLFQSVIGNWDKIQDDTKLIFFGLILGLAIWYSYSKKDDKKNKKKDKKKKNKQKEE